MPDIEVRPGNYSYAFSSYLEPVVKVKPGDRVIIHTEDAFEGRIKSKSDLPSKVLADAKFLNPLSGPIYVEGAQPNDTLSVYIESIEPTTDFAVSCFVNYFGGLSSTHFTRLLQDPIPEKTWIWTIKEEAEEKYLINDEIRVRVPWDPFMGSFGVAPFLEAISSLTPGPFGGNMDVPDVKPLNTIYLPVYNNGALFFVGDCHAHQGQGELCGVALEIPCKLSVVFDVIKGKKIEWPRIISEEAIMVIGSARPMEDAARIAYTELALWMEGEFGFTRWEAYQLLTQVGGLYVGNMVDTTYSLVASIRKTYLKHQ
ncbi:MAG: acetamidase/formamidase family protein [Deltaproteobacteria bacterium]|nr:acetamidase/formamidase family protein [Deltaproteobacteria bacterium]